MEKRYVIILNQVCDYEQKAPFVQSGESVFGALEYDPVRGNGKAGAGALRCHECGGWFQTLAHHIRKHDLSPKDYRHRHGISPRTSLSSPAYAEFHRQHSRKFSAHLALRNTVQSKAAFLARMNAGRARLRASRGNLSQDYYHEDANLKGRCKEQLIARVKQIASDLGRTPTAKDFRALGLDNALTRIFGTGRVRAVQIEAGLVPTLRGGRTDNFHHEAKYTKEILVELLRDFYVANRRIPTTADLECSLLPSKRTFQKYFGSVRAACFAAGLGYRLVTQAGSAPGGRIKVLIDNPLSQQYRTSAAC